jgi:hypothetical protein
LNLDRAVNYSARNWYKNQTQLELPLDSRPLRDRVRPVNTNVIRYERRGAERIARARVLEQGEVLYIGDDAPIPSGKETREWSDGDDILYIE